MSFYLSHWISKQNLSFRLHYIQLWIVVKKICLLLKKKIFCLILIWYLKPSLLQIFIYKYKSFFSHHYIYSIMYCHKKTSVFYSTTKSSLIFKAISLQIFIYKYKFVILSLTCWFDLQWTTATDKVDSQVQVIIMLRSAASSKLILFPFFGNQIFLLKML